MRGAAGRFLGFGLCAWVAVASLFYLLYMGPALDAEEGRLRKALEERARRRRSSERVPPVKGDDGARERVAAEKRRLLSLIAGTRARTMTIRADAGDRERQAGGIRTRLEGMKDRLPGSLEVTRVVRRLDPAGFNGKGFSATHISAEQTRPLEGGILANPFVVDGEGSYADLVLYLENLEKLRLQHRLESLVLNLDPVKGILRVSLRISVFTLPPAAREEK